MQRRGAVLVMAGAMLGWWGTVCLAQTGVKAAGHWVGKILIPNRELAITVDLAQDAKGAWTGSMTAQGSTAVDVPLDSVSVENGQVRFKANLPQRASFEAKLSADGKSLSGTASSAAGEAEFQLTREGEADVKTAPPSTALTKEFEGSWEGTIEAGGKTIRVGVKLSQAADGTAVGMLLSPDQGNLEIPATTVTIKGKDLRLEARAVSGTYHGTLGAGGEIAGEWTQGSSSIPLTLKRVAPEAKKP